MNLKSFAAGLFAAISIAACSENTPLGNTPDSPSATTRISVTDGAALSGFHSNYLSAVPQVTVTDRQGLPLAGKEVRFVANGGGQLTGAMALTDSAGHASPTSWRLGRSGSQTVTVTSGDANPLTIVAGALEPPASSFRIEIRYAAGTEPTEAQRAAFTAAAATWTRLILKGGAPYPIYEYDSTCGDLRGQTIDGLVITADLKPIDGAGKILGSAGPCILRDADYLPVQGYMQFDTADLATLEARGQLDEVILHEMAHVLGFGTIWEIFAGAGLPTNAFLLKTMPADPIFTGAASRAALYGIAGAVGFGGTPVPVEGTGDPGTAYAHWRESIFNNELMTGWLNGGINPLSALTLAQFRDLGYVVNDALGESYSFTAALQGQASVSQAPLQLIEGKLTMPILVVNRQGHLVRRIDRLQLK